MQGTAPDESRSSPFLWRCSSCRIFISPSKGILTSSVFQYEYPCTIYSVKFLMISSCHYIKRLKIWNKFYTSCMIKYSFNSVIMDSRWRWAKRWLRWPAFLIRCSFSSGFSDGWPVGLRHGTDFRKESGCGYVLRRNGLSERVLDSDLGEKAA
jgi:hypothetical protein